MNKYPIFDDHEGAEPSQKTHSRPQPKACDDGAAEASGTPQHATSNITEKLSVQDVFKMWDIAFERACQSKESMTRLPPFPHEFCDRQNHTAPGLMSCDSVESQQARRLRAYSHSIEHVIRSAYNSAAEVKKIRDQLHPDEFNSCLEVHRADIKAEVEEIFNVCDKIYTEMSNAS